MRAFQVALVVAVLVLSSTAGFAGYIVNGSFEQPGVTDAMQFFNGQTIGAGWKVLSGNTAYIVNNNANQGFTPFGAQFLEIHGDAVTQSISNLVPGRTYDLSYFATAQSNANYFGNGQILASIAGRSDTFAYSLSGINSYGSVQLPWTFRRLRFTANSFDELLTISGSGSLNSNPLAAIDNVSITAVPEPSSLLVALLLVALGCVLRFTLPTRTMFAMRKMRGCNP